MTSDTGPTTPGWAGALSGGLGGEAVPGMPEDGELTRVGARGRALRFGHPLLLSALPCPFPSSSTLLLLAARSVPAPASTVRQALSCSCAGVVLLRASPAPSLSQIEVPRAGNASRPIAYKTKGEIKCTAQGVFHVYLVRGRPRARAGLLCGGLLFESHTDPPLSAAFPVPTTSLYRRSGPGVTPASRSRCPRSWWCTSTGCPGTTPTTCATAWRT